MTAAMSLNIFTVRLDGHRLLAAINSARPAL